jgi:hypothetical protein
VLGPGLEEARLEPTAPLTGTRIEVHRSTDRPPRDAELIASLCRHASAEITVNGRSVTDRPGEPMTLRPRHFQGPRGLCQAFFEPLGPTTAELRIVQHGVVVQVLPRPRRPSNLRIAALADGLPTDLTGFALRDSPGTAALLSLCEGHAREREGLTPEVTRFARDAAQQRLVRLLHLRGLPILWGIPVALFVAAVLGILLVRRAIPAWFFFPGIFGIIGAFLLATVLWDRFRVRPLARTLLPRGTLLHREAGAIVGEGKGGAENRKSFDL